MRTREGVDQDSLVVISLSSHCYRISLGLDPSFSPHIIKYHLHVSENERHRVSHVLMLIYGIRIRLRLLTHPRTRNASFYFSSRHASLAIFTPDCLRKHSTACRSFLIHSYPYRSTRMMPSLCLCYSLILCSSELISGLFLSGGPWSADVFLHSPAIFTHRKRQIEQQYSRVGGADQACLWFISPLPRWSRWSRVERHEWAS